MMKCDELQQVENPIEWGLYYDKSEVDEAIAELKEFAEDACLERDDNQTAIDELQAENAQLKAENAQLKKETEFMHSNCKWDAGEGCARLLGEKLAIIEENEKLKQKLENVQASMYADVVDANMKNRRLQRALWIARAERAKTEHLSKIMYSTLFRDFIEKWVNVERKCRAKAEEYK